MDPSVNCVQNCGKLSSAKCAIFVIEANCKARAVVTVWGSREEEGRIGFKPFCILPGEVIVDDFTRIYMNTQD